MLKVRDIVLISLLSVIFYGQKLLLMNIPNVQLTIFLTMLFSKKIGTFKTVIIIIIYVILDCIFMGSMNGVANLFFVPFIFLGLLIIPLTINTIFNKVNNLIYLSLLSILYSLLYSWILIIPGCLMFEMNVFTYLAGDIVWELMLCLSSVFCIIILYMPCSNVFDRYLKTDLN